MLDSYKPSLKLNVFANYGGKFWSIVSVYIFVPIYIRILGVDAYALIAFNAIVLAFLFVADAGLSASFAREAARNKDHLSLVDTLISVERLLFLILLIIGVLFAFFSPIIADYWLKNDGLERILVIQSLFLMPFAIVPQILMALYQGGLMGLEHQVSANFLSTVFSVIRSGLVVIPIYLWPDVRIFFAWQVASSIIMMFIMRAALFRYIGIGCVPNSKSQHNYRGRFSLDAVMKIRGFALGMFAMSLIAGLHTQLDKLVVSKMLEMTEFAQYSLVSILAQIPYLLTLPIATALLPRFTNLLEGSENQKLTMLYRSATYYITCLGAIAGIGLCLFNTEVMALWIQDMRFDLKTANAAKLLALGSMFLTFQLAPFQLGLAHGYNTTNVRLGAFMLIISIPLQLVLTKEYGVLGAAIPWFLMNLVAMIYLGVSLNLRFPFVSLPVFFLYDTLLPALVGLFALVGARLLADSVQAGPIISCAIAAIGSCIALILAYMLRTKLFMFYRIPR